jgi:hypothetical protein
MDRILDGPGSYLDCSNGSEERNSSAASGNRIPVVCSVAITLLNELGITFPEFKINRETMNRLEINYIYSASLISN